VQPPTYRYAAKAIRHTGFNLIIYGFRSIENYSLVDAMECGEHEFYM